MILYIIPTIHIKFFTIISPEINLLLVSILSFNSCMIALDRFNTTFLLFNLDNFFPFQTIIYFPCSFSLLPCFISSKLSDSYIVINPQKATTSDIFLLTSSVKLFSNCFHKIIIFRIDSFKYEVCAGLVVTDFSSQRFLRLVSELHDKSQPLMQPLILYRASHDQGFF